MLQHRLLKVKYGIHDDDEIRFFIRKVKQCLLKPDRRPASDSLEKKLLEKATN